VASNNDGMAAATTVVAMRAASNKEDKGAGRVTTRAMAAAKTVAAMRVASNKEGEGGNAMELVTRLAGEQWRWRQEGSGDGNKGGRQGCHGKRLNHGDVLF
jgi:hypothetical protein